MYNVSDCKVISIQTIHNRAGNISIVDKGMEVPFVAKRIYYLYDIPTGESRGGHAHKELEQFIVSASGSFDITLDDGNEKMKFHLSRAHMGLYIRPGIWRDLDNFSTGAVCVVLASYIYNEDDYIRDYNVFLNFRNK